MAVIQEVPRAKGICVGMKLFTADPKLISENPDLKEISWTTKTGFPEVFLPGIERHDFYLTLEDGDFSSDKKGPNIEITAQLRKDNGGEIVKVRLPPPTSLFFFSLLAMKMKHSRCAPLCRMQSSWAPIQRVKNPSLSTDRSCCTIPTSPSGLRQFVCPFLRPSLNSATSTSPFATAPPPTVRKTLSLSHILLQFLLQYLTRVPATTITTTTTYRGQGEARIRQCLSQTHQPRRNGYSRWHPLHRLLQASQEPRRSCILSQRKNW